MSVFIGFNSKIRTAKNSRALGSSSLWLLSILLAICQTTAAYADTEAGSTRTSAKDKLTALDRYVAAPDTNYSYRVLNTVRGQGATAFIIEMTSQAWLTAKEVSKPVWKHALIITRPDKVASRNALLVIGGGNNEKPFPKGPDDNALRTAIQSQSVVAELRHVPNQPLIFMQDGTPRSEDDLIAYTWDKFLRTGDERWPARLPMTKSAVRAMDTITSFCSSTEGGQIPIDGFIVAGGSKRGWTTWTTAAVDRRVVAIVPIVIDVLNIVPSMRHHYASYGFWAPAVGDYTNHHIMEWMGSREFAALDRIEEPYSYRQRFTMPKLLINATGDQFFLPDSSQFYFDELPGAKYLRYVPNADHSLKGSDAWESLDAFYRSILLNRPIPRLKWKLGSRGTIQATTPDSPREVRLWQATNEKARDFRLETFGPNWTSSPLTAQHGRYQAQIKTPQSGWTAYLIEFTFPGPEGTTLKLTTSVGVVPDRTDYQVPNRPHP
jgi:PhoPQ-activated pathogenicity-related protein